MSINTTQNNTNTIHNTTNEDEYENDSKTWEERGPSIKWVFLSYALAGVFLALVSIFNIQSTFLCMVICMVLATVEIVIIAITHKEWFEYATDFTPMLESYLSDKGLDMEAGNAAIEKDRQERLARKEQRKNLKRK